jgi:hypothetical protein
LYLLDYIIDHVVAWGSAFGTSPPSLKFSPKELLLGLVVNTANTPLKASASLLPPQDIDMHRLFSTQSAARRCLTRKLSTTKEAK